MENSTEVIRSPRKKGLSQIILILFYIGSMILGIMYSYINVADGFRFIISIIIVVLLIKYNPYGGLLSVGILLFGYFVMLAQIEYYTDYHVVFMKLFIHIISIVMLLVSFKYLYDYDEYRNDYDRNWLSRGISVVYFGIGGWVVISGYVIAFQKGLTQFIVSVVFPPLPVIYGLGFTLKIMF